jgi:glycosyltransferase 2 family protein
MPDRGGRAPVDTQVGNSSSRGPQEPAGSPAAGGRLGRAVSTLLRLAGSRPVRWGFIVATVGLGAYAIASEWSYVRSGLAQLGFWSVAAALICVLIALLALMQIYRVLLAALGSSLSARHAAQILFVGQLGKYLPGSVWPVLAQMELGSAYRVPRTRSASASVLTMLMSLLSGILVGLVILPFKAGATPYWWVFLFAPVILVCLYPPILNRLLDRLLRLAKRQPLEEPLTGRVIALAMAWGVVGWILYGLQIWLLASRLGASGSTASLLALAIGGFAFAWCAGFLVVIAPAGAGVREVVLIALLTPTLSLAKATAVALVSRVLMTVGDLLCAWLAAVFARRSRPAG